MKQDQEKIEGFHEGSISHQLVLAIEAGAEKTVSEWAKHLDVSHGSIRNNLRNLRRKGYLYYSSGASHGGFGDSVEGKVINVIKNKRSILNTIERHDKHSLAPALESAFRIFEEAVKKYPEMYDIMETRLSSILVKMMNEKEQLKLAQAGVPNEDN
jgi:hypothetical protein